MLESTLLATAQIWIFEKDSLKDDMHNAGLSGNYTILSVTYNK